MILLGHECTLHDQRRPHVAQAFPPPIAGVSRAIYGGRAEAQSAKAGRPANGRWAALKGCATFIFASLITLGFEAVVGADGGLLRARQTAGPFTVSIFTTPEPLRVGAVDVSVLVQSSGGGVVTDADVDVLFESATRPIQQRRATATYDAASNKLASAAVVDLPAAGQWTLTVSVRSNGNAATVTCLLPVAPARSRMSVIWPWLLVPPLGIALFGVHQTLKRHRSSVRSARGSVFASRT